MDVKIKDKDIAFNSCGDALYIDNFDEVLQRIKIACTIKKGSFVFDRNLGVESINIDFSDDMLAKKLEMIFKEATINIGYDDLKVVSVDKENATCVLMVTCGKDVKTVEVTVDGKL